MDSKTKINRKQKVERYAVGDILRLTDGRTFKVAAVVVVADTVELHVKRMPSGKH